MKIKPKHLDHMRSAIKSLLDERPDVVHLYETGQFPKAERVKDLQKRICFDLLHYAGLSPWVCNVLYKEEFVNDAHLYTALKKICPKVIRKY